MSATATTQPMQALAYANAIRCNGRRIRREMGELSYRESRQRAIELLRNPPPEIARMRVGFFLSGIHRHGPKRVRDTLREAELLWASEHRVGPFECSQRNHLRRLTARQREVLATVLEEGL